MNTLETYQILAPSNKEDTCAKFVIDNIASPFLLDDIMTIGMNYVFSCWIKSDIEGSITVANTRFECSPNNWTRVSVKFTASSDDLVMVFGVAGIYYVYRAQLEIGTIATDWSPAPEDLDSADQLAETNAFVQQISESMSKLDIRAEAIESSVETTNTRIDGISGKVLSVETELSTLKQSASDLTIGFTNITDNGVTKVTTETGFTFDKEGMTIDNSDSQTKTQVTPDGMTVYKKDADGGKEEVLEATSEGVDATNLHAKTYLIVGGRSRFENFGQDRTGCFWIGG